MRRSFLAVTIATTITVAGCSPGPDSAPTALEDDLRAEDPARVLSAVAVSPGSDVTAQELADAAEMYVASAAERPSDVHVDEATSTARFTLDGREHTVPASQVDGTWVLLVDPAPVFELVTYGWTLTGSGLGQGGGSLHLLPGVYELQAGEGAADWMTPSSTRVVVLPGQAPDITWQPTDALLEASEAEARAALLACSSGCEAPPAFPGVDPADPAVTFPVPQELRSGATAGGTNGDMTWATAPVTFTGSAGGTVQGVARVDVDLRLTGSTWELHAGDVAISRE